MTHARNASLVTRRNAARNKTSPNKARRNNNPETIRKTMTIHDNECRARQCSTTKTNNNKQHMCTRNLPNQNRKHECQTSMWHGEQTNSPMVMELIFILTLNPYRVPNDAQTKRPKSECHSEWRFQVNHSVVKNFILDRHHCIIQHKNPLCAWRSRMFQLRHCFLEIST